MGHAGAAQGLHQGLLDDAVLHVQGQLAGALLGGAPAHTVGQTGDVLDLLGLDPFALFGDGSGTMVRALGNGAHILHFGRVDHVRAFLSLYVFFRKPPISAASDGFLHNIISVNDYLVKQRDSFAQNFYTI